MFASVASEWIMLNHNKLYINASAFKDTKIKSTFCYTKIELIFCNLYKESIQYFVKSSRFLS